MTGSTGLVNQAVAVFLMMTGVILATAPTQPFENEIRADAIVEATYRDSSRRFDSKATFTFGTTLKGAVDIGSIEVSGKATIVDPDSAFRHQPAMWAVQFQYVFPCVTAGNGAARGSIQRNSDCVYQCL